ncbi:hypothetical protein FB45DRAFT_1065543 [Roridomyces roridus]|uniref:F-box domain-containing protein n=1 Tax=Roridomyces roridus TaxID=1738132 RepID=A0AAD7B746_9AGAR|nr:hypothetical protein FB45DRAFT_1065543 [Roridomyces roridus]
MLLTRGGLPNELLIELIELTPRADQATLCRTSKYIQAITLPILNRTVVLGESTSVDAFSQSIINDPGRASATRALIILHRLNYAKSTYDSLLKALELLKFIDYFSLQVTSGTYCYETFLHRLDRLTFPLLVKCYISIPSHKIRVQNVTQFLSRNPTITHLRLWPVQGPYAVSDSDWTAPMLPNLQHYRGTSALLPAFSTRNLRTVVASLDPTDYGALRSLANPELPFAISIDTCNPIRRPAETLQRALRLLPQHMPFVTQLRIRCWDQGNRMNPNVIHDIASRLPLLTRLEHFELNFAYGYATRHVDRFVIDAESDRQALQTLADACPTLKACLLVDQSWKKVHGIWDEYPTTEFQKEFGFSVLDFMD